MGAVRNAAGQGSPAAQSAPAPANAKEPAEVTVRGKESSAQRQVRSAEAVTVVEMRRAKEQTADMGEVLARTQGISVRRGGGLGSEARFSLNGLTDEQVRFFLDGVPLAFAGYPFGIANVPVNLVQRVEVYRGIVPIRFGADALGGAVNLVTDATYAPRLSASYQTGSNGIYRLTLDGRTHDEATGLVFGATAFFDRAKNNYDVDVKVAGPGSHEIEASGLPRFHDGYLAAGGGVEVGVVDRPWARRLILRGFATGFDKELQSNIIMTGAPYGDATYGARVYGATLRYEQPLARGLDFEAVANYSRRFLRFTDVSTSVYDWFGHRLGTHSGAGEVDDGRPSDQAYWQDTEFARVGVTWTLAKEHVLRVSTSPTLLSRRGEERTTPAGMRDELDIRRRLFTLNSGVEYEMNLFGGRLQNIAFVKDYLYAAQSQEGPTTGFRPLDVNRHTLGAGNAIRFRVNSWLYAKASYERATRLPSADEVFGNGALIKSNIALEPEISHNANVGPRIELRRTSAGDLTIDTNAFLRDSDKLIQLLGAATDPTYQNIYHARALGIESGAAWTAPGRFLTLDGTFTYNDVRNTGSDGPFGRYEGDRIPSRPWLFASWGARLRFTGLPGPNDSVEPFYIGRYVHSFYRSWESQGSTDTKPIVDAQTTHTAGVTWTVYSGDTRIASTFEVDNLTDARVYDTFGAQRPGRQYFIKVTADMR